MLREQSLTNASPTEDVPRARPRLQPRCSGHKVEEEKKELEKRTPSSIPPLRGRVRTRPKFCCLGFCACFFRSAFPEGEGCGGFAVDVLQLSGGGIIPHRTAAVCPGEGARKGGGEGGGNTERGSGEVHCSHTERVRSFSFSFIVFKGRREKTQTLQPVFLL